MKKTFIICNPAAGAGLAHERWSKLNDDLIEHNIDFDYQADIFNHQIWN